MTILDLPQPDPADDAALLEDVEAFVRRYVVLSDDQAVAVVLWVAHTHAFDAAEATPYLSVTSAEKESGKSRLLETLELLVSTPWKTERVSAAALVRKVHTISPTLLLDESDTAFKEGEYGEVLRGVLNSGYRRGGKATICVKSGGDWDARDFSTFCPKAVAGIGDLPDTVASRSIPVRLKRRAPGETVARFRAREAADAAEPIHTALRSWGEYRLDQLADARPPIPDALGDRAADVWEPLLAIADLAGFSWPDRARRAAAALSSNGLQADTGSLGVRLLADVRAAFEADGPRIKTADLIRLLSADEEAPWGEWRGYGPIKPRVLAGLLRPYGIRAGTIRLPDGRTAKGYKQEDFEDAFARYLPPHPSHASHPAPDAGFRPPAFRHTTSAVTDTEPGAKPHRTSDVTDVTDRSGGYAEGEHVWGLA